MQRPRLTTCHLVVQDKAVCGAAPDGTIRHQLVGPYTVHFATDMVPIRAVCVQCVWVGGGCGCEVLFGVVRGLSIYVCVGGGGKRWWDGGSLLLSRGLQRMAENTDNLGHLLCGFFEYYATKFPCVARAQQYGVCE